MDNILINFATGDQSGLKSTEDGLDAILTKEGEVGSTWKKTSQQMLDSNNIVAKSVTDLVNSTKSLDKAVIGGAYTKYLKDIQTQLQLTNNQVLTYLNNTKKSAQQSLLAANDPQEIANFKEVISLTNDQISLFTTQQKAARLEGSNFTTQLRAIRNEILSLTEAEAQNPDISGQTAQRIAELTTKYSEVQRIQRQFQIKSQGLVQNNEVLAGTLSLVSGLAGGYAVLQGASALFGDQSEEVQKALLKVNAAMSILQGLQQITAVIQKSSAASILLESIARKGQAAAVTTETAAEIANTTSKDDNIASTEIAAATSDADTIAKGAETAATQAATGATEELNVALLDNPITAVIAGVVALGFALHSLSDNTAATAGWQAVLNDELEQSGELADLDLEAQKRRSELIIANAKNQGASETQLIALQGRSNNERLDMIDKQAQAAAKAYNEQQAQIYKLQSIGIDVDKDILKSVDELYKKKEEKDKEYTELYHQQLLLRQQYDKSLNDDLYNSYVAFQNKKIAETISGTDAERLAQIQALKDIAVVRENNADFLSKTETEKELIRAEDQKKIDDLVLQNYEHLLKDKVAATDAAIDVIKAHQAASDAEAINGINKISDLQISAIKKQLATDLANPTLNVGERQKLIAAADLAEFEAEKKRQTDILSFQKQGINDLIAASNKGSLEEATYKLALIENERKAELVAAGKNADLINEINAKFNKQRSDADDTYDKIRLQNEVSLDNASLDNFNLTEQQKLPIVLKRLGEEESIELLGAENNAKKIAEIQANYELKRRDAIIASNKAIFDEAVKSFDALNAIGTAKNTAIISDPLSSAVAKQIASDELLRTQEDKIVLERNQLEKDKLLISAQDYQTRLEVINNEEDANNKAHADRAIKIFQDEQQRKLDIIKGIISVLQNSLNALDTSGLKTGLTEALGLFNNVAEAIAKYQAALKDPNADKALAKQAEQAAIVGASIIAIQNTINQVFSDAAAQRQQELSDYLTGLENQKNVELSNTNLTEKQKADITARFNEKEKQAKIAAFNADKQAKKEQIIIEGALNIVKAFPNIILMAVAAGLTAVELAVVSSEPTPRFKHGKVDIQGNGTSTSDSIHARISRGESIIKADSTAKWKDALTAINNDKFEDYISKNLKHFIFPHVPETLQAAGGKEIDYEKLATVMATKMKGVIPGAKSMHFNIDKNGIYTIVQDGNSRTEIKNKRYSMK